MNYITALYSQHFLAYLSKVRLLVVGVGGIGCELLKVLGTLPICNVEVLDLDTIEITNLNRQFLFRPQHKGQSKARVAAQVMKLNKPNLRLVPHEANIFEMPNQFFAKFDAVIMALDNIQARTYVNNVCMRLDKILLDAGTSGFKGQVQACVRGISKCYSCQKRQIDSPQTFPSCTIRNRPEKPIHCIVWAKYLFEAFFTSQEETLLIDLKGLAMQQSTDQNLQKIFDQLFFNDVLKHNSQAQIQKFNINPLKGISIPASEMTLQTGISQSNMNKTHAISSYRNIFKESLQKLLACLKEKGPFAFEKDDMDILAFIGASACIRMIIFGLKPVSFYEIKEMAAKIVPAIASTNSLVAAIQVSQLLKLLRMKYQKKTQGSSSIAIKQLYVQNSLSKKVIANKHQRPSPACRACNLDFRAVQLTLDAKLTKLGQLTSLIQKHSRLKQYSLSQGNIVLLSVDSYMDEEQIHENELKKEKMLSQFLRLPIQHLTLYDEAQETIACFIVVIDLPVPSIRLDYPQAFNHLHLSNVKTEAAPKVSKPMEREGTVVIDQSQPQSQSEGCLVVEKPGRGRPLEERQEAVIKID